MVVCVWPLGLQSSTTAGCQGPGAGSPWEGNEGQVNVKGRNRNSAPLPLLFFWGGCEVGQKGQPKEIWLLKDPQGWFHKVIALVLVDVTRGHQTSSGSKHSAYKPVTCMQQAVVHAISGICMHTCACLIMHG